VDGCFGFLGQLQSLGAIGSGKHVIAIFLQEQLREFADGLSILGKQDGFGAPESRFHLPPSARRSERSWVFRLFVSIRLPGP
jgi:hypothetical protein